MALVIAVGHGTFTDPFTCSTSSQDSDDLSKMEDCLERIRADQFPDSTFETVKTWVDEILVVENDDVVHHFSWEDGLGETIPEVPLDMPLDEVEAPGGLLDFESDSDEGDSQDA